MRFIMLTVLIDMIAIGIIVPVLPVLVGSFAGSKSSQAFWYGAVSFAFGIANFLRHRSWVRCRIVLVADRFCCWAFVGWA